MPPFLFDATRWEDWEDSLADHAVPIAIILALLLAAEYLFRKVVSGVLRRAIGRAARSRIEDPVGLRRRADTLSATLNWAFGIFLLFLGVGLVLSEAGLNVAALIAGVGVVGIAVGLGAQTLVRDVLTGLFILIEDQYSVGDLVTVGGITGEVIEINPRRTVLRDADGNTHSVPNSAIVVASNLTPGLGRVRVELDVPYGEVGRAISIVEEVAAGLGRERGTEFTRPPRLEQVAAMPEGGVRLRVTADTRPEARWELAAELRSRLVASLEESGIEVGNGGRDGASEAAAVVGRP